MIGHVLTPILTPRKVTCNMEVLLAKANSRLKNLKISIQCMAGLNGGEDVTLNVQSKRIKSSL
jgi:hypothetical protein